MDCNLLNHNIFISSKILAQRCPRRFEGIGNRDLVVVGWRLQPSWEKEMRSVRALAVPCIALLMANGCGEGGRKEAGAEGESPATDAPAVGS